MPPAPDPDRHVARLFDTSFLNFVYPFHFLGEQFERRVAAVERATWPIRDRQQATWGPARFQEDEVLPHVSRYLNRQDEKATARLWSLEESALTSQQGLGGGPAPEPPRTARVAWSLAPGGRDEEIPFHLETARLVLFRVGIGLLSVRVKPATPRLDHWLDLVHYFRFAGGGRACPIRARQLVRGQAEPRPFFPSPAGGLERHPDGEGRFGEILAALLETGGTDRWWEDVFIPGQLLPFAGLLLESEPPEGTPSLLYRVRSFFHAEQVLHAAPDDLRPDHPALMAYAERQWMLFSLDGGAFVAIDPPRSDFFLNVLPDHLQQQYFLLFLVALHQRFTLTRLLADIAGSWIVGSDDADVEEREGAFERIRDTLLTFTARGYFAQVMQREHHHRAYRRWQEVFQIERLYHDVRDAVQDMHQQVSGERSQRLEAALEQQRRTEEEQARGLEQTLAIIGASLAAFFGVPALVLAFLGVNLRGLTSSEGLDLTWTLAAVIIAFGAGILFAGLLYRVIRWLLRRAADRGPAP